MTEIKIFSVAPALSSFWRGLLNIFKSTFKQEDIQMIYDALTLMYYFIRVYIAEAKKYTYLFWRSGWKIYTYYLGALLTACPASFHGYFLFAMIQPRRTFVTAVLIWLWHVISIISMGKSNLVSFVPTTSNTPLTHVYEL